MNFHIYIEVQQLKLYLQKHPKQAAQLAIAHLEDYLILLNECRHLEKQIELLRYAPQYTTRVYPQVYPLGQCANALALKD